jgi:hypothetical protein
VAPTKLGWLTELHRREWRDGTDTFEARSPIDRELPSDLRDRHSRHRAAVARAAQPAWAAIRRERLAITARPSTSATI